ncbi:MAG: flippase [Solirubrobacteraceae bacterium]
MVQEGDSPDIDSGQDAIPSVLAAHEALAAHLGDPLSASEMGAREMKGDVLVQEEASDVAASAPPVVTRLFAKASATAMLQGASSIMAFVLAVLLARFLGSRGYGHYALAFAWSTLLGVPAILGLNTFLVRGIAVYEVRKQWALMKGLLFRANQLVLISSSAIAVFGIAVAVIFLSPSFRDPFCVAMLLVPVTSLTLLRQGAMQGFGRVVQGQFPEYLVRPLLIIVGVIMLQFLGNGALTPTTALGANLIGVAVAFVVGVLMLRRAIPAVLRTVYPEYLTREWLRVSLPMMLISGVWIANNYLTTLIVGALDGARGAGIYTAVQKGAEVIVILLYATNMALAPAIARLHAAKDWSGLERTTEHMARATLFVSAPVAIVFMVFPHLYLGLFGASFQAGATALVILALGQLINAAAGPSGNVLLMTGQERVAVAGVGVGLVANIVLAVALVPLFGVTGGAIAFASSLVLWNTVLVVLARRLVGINVTAFGILSIRSRRRSGV